jgi:hypothetical protein
MSFNSQPLLINKEVSVHKESLNRFSQSFLKWRQTSTKFEDKRLILEIYIIYKEYLL